MTVLVDLIAEAREWLAELTFGDVDPDDFLDPDLFSDNEIRTAVTHLYEGGWAAFTANTQPEG
jgi:hypothetical protein